MAAATPRIRARNVTGNGDNPHRPAWALPRSLRDPPTAAAPVTTTTVTGTVTVAARNWTVPGNTRCSSTQHLLEPWTTATTRTDESPVHAGDTTRSREAPATIKSDEDSHQVPQGPLRRLHNAGISGASSGPGSSAVPLRPQRSSEASCWAGRGRRVRVTRPPWGSRDRPPTPASRRCRRPRLRTRAGSGRRHSPRP